MKKELPVPETQHQEVLYQLMTRPTIDRYTMMISCGVGSLTTVISELRTDYKVDIETIIKTKYNRYGRQIKYAIYKLRSKPNARKIYFSMKSNQLNVAL